MKGRLQMPVEVLNGQPFVLSLLQSIYLTSSLISVYISMNLDVKIRTKTSYYKA